MCFSSEINEPLPVAHAKNEERDFFLCISWNKTGYLKICTFVKRVIVQKGGIWTVRQPLQNNESYYGDTTNCPTHLSRFRRVFFFPCSLLFLLLFSMGNWVRKFELNCFIKGKHAYCDWRCIKIEINQLNIPHTISNQKM